MTVLLSRHVDLSGHHGFYGNALQAAAYNGHIRAVQMLLDRGASLSAPGRFAGAFQAALHGNQENVFYLLRDYGARITNPSTCRMSFMESHSHQPLEYRPRSQRQPIPDNYILLERGPMPFVVGPLEVVAGNGNLSLLSNLWRHGTTVEHKDY